MRKYVLAGCATIMFLVGLRLTRDSLWILPLLAAWELAGVIWYIYFSQNGKLWSLRKQGGLFRDLMQVVAVGAFCLGWPLWLTAGEDVFD